MTDPRYTSPETSRRLYEAGVRCETARMVYGIGWRIIPIDQVYPDLIGLEGRYPALDLHDLLTWWAGNDCGMVQMTERMEQGVVGWYLPGMVTGHWSERPVEGLALAILVALNAGHIALPSLPDTTSSARLDVLPSREGQDGAA